MKKLLSVFLSICLLCSCTSTPDKPNEEFTSFCDQIFIETMESDYTTMHQMLENPEDFHIDLSKVEVSLGDFITDNDKKIKENLNTLHSFDYDSLDHTQKSIYLELEKEWNLELNLNKEEILYNTNVLSSMNGIHEQLITFFSEYTLRNEQDVKDLIVLIKDVPRYFDEMIAYIKKQADMDLLMYDTKSVLNSIQEIIDSREDSSVTSHLMNEIDSLSIDSKEDYKSKVEQVLQNDFFPSYQRLLDTLIQYEDQVIPMTGLYYIKNGKEYYKYIVEQATGTTKSIETIQKELENALDDTLKDYLKLSDYETSLTTSFTTVEEILSFLNENYKKDFPEVGQMNYEIKALDDDQSTDGVVAYFIIPAIDNSSPYQIRYNKRDYGKDIEDIEMYTTLAHEGIMGHMYQAQYNLENLDTSIQYLFNSSGLSEGYATYAQLYALKYLDKDTKACKLENELNFYLTALLDLSIHYDGLTLEELNEQYNMDMSSFYNQIAENPGVFLSYYYGYLQVNQLKESFKGSDLQFHTQLLQYGNVYFDVLSKMFKKS